jgi:hypothetical protein
MLYKWPIRDSRLFFVVLALCMTAQISLASSNAYHQNVSVAQDGKPSLQLTNDSELPITAFIMVEFPSLGMEGRTYFDVYTNSTERTISPGASIIRGLSYFRGSDVTRVRADVRAVIFKDGSSVGDPVWINAALARRLRLYDRTLSLYDLLIPLVGTGVSRDAILDLLRAAQADSEKQLPDDDLRVMDAVAFYGAISTLDKNRRAPVDIVLREYLEYLKRRALYLEYSRPNLETIRTLPARTPKPLSEGTLPAEFRALRASLASNAPGSSLSYCEILPQAFHDDPVPSLTCSEGVQNNNFTFSADSFTQYNATTNKSVDVIWNSPASEGPFQAVGACWAFTDCDGASDIYYVQGTATGMGAANQISINLVKVTQGQTPQQFYWMLDRYPQPTLADCDECDPYPGGQENPVSANAPVPTTKWSFDYACNISP